MPKRLQRTRRAGSKLPADAIYVGRPTRFGNMYAIRRDGSTWTVLDVDGSVHTSGLERSAAHELAVALYAARTADGGPAPFTTQQYAALAGADLVCWCPPQLACHADVLVERANRGQSTTTR